MNWSDIKNIVGNVAPLVGTAVGGPAGAAIGSMLSQALGVDNNPEAVSEALKADPQAMLKLKQFELENEKDLRAHSFKVVDRELANQENARAIHKHNPMPMIICIALTTMVAGGSYMLFTMTIPADNKQIANLLFGTLLGQWSASIAYWVGTTRSSSEKTRLLR